MTDTSTDTGTSPDADASGELREQVRARYAAAATAVSTTGRDALAVVDADQSCCGPTGTASALIHRGGCDGGRSRRWL